MIPMQVCALKQDVGNDGEDAQRDALLDDLQLHEVEWSAVTLEAYSVCGHLTTVLKEGNNPREGDDANQWPVVGDSCLLEFQMPIPSQRHEDVA